MNKKEIILKQLTGLAFKLSKPFCYPCYEEVKDAFCLHCGSDDNMRLLEGVGVEYGTEWVIDEILKKELKPIDEKEVFESMIEDCYQDEVQVGWLKLNTLEVLKEISPCDWDLAQDEYISSLEEDEEIMSFDDGSTYYWIYDLENLLESRDTNNLQIKRKI